MEKKETIDKSIQEHINKEKEHWRAVLLRILAVVKRLVKDNLAFRGENEKIYQERNEIFLSSIEMIVEFDVTMQQHIRKFKVVRFITIILVTTSKMRSFKC